MIEVKVKKLTDKAVLPAYATDGSAGMDVTATSIRITDDYIEYGTGLAFELPPGYMMLIFPRSSVSKEDLLLANSVGVLDSSYRGELKLRFKRSFRCYHIDDNHFDFSRVVTDHVSWYEAADTEWQATKIYEVGDRVGQIIIMPYPKVEFLEVEELAKTERGDGGFGSTGK